MCTGQETEGKLRQLHMRTELFLVKEVTHYNGCPEIMVFQTSLRIVIQLNEALGNLT